jgi:3',5'-cyclic AMP phosphodiesterase CpdA
VRTIAHISDIHFGALEPGAPEALRHDLQADPPDFLIVSGDFTQRATPQQYRDSVEFVKSIGVPWLGVPGNHDIPLYNVLERFGSPLRKYRKYVTRDLRPVHEDADVLILGLNSARPISRSTGGFWKDGRLNTNQLEYAEARLAAATGGPGQVKIVVTHHPFLPPPGARPHGIIRRAKRALKVFDRAGVDVLLAGHLHMNYSGDLRVHHERLGRGILAVQAGTATSSRRRGEPNAYNRLSLDPAAGRLRIEVRAREEAGTFAPLTSQTFTRDADGNWSPA